MQSYISKPKLEISRQSSEEEEDDSIMIISPDHHRSIMYLNFAFSEEPVKNFIDSFLELETKLLDRSDVDQKITIFVDSAGGEDTFAYQLYHIFKTSKVDIEFVLCGGVDSFALTLMLAMSDKVSRVARSAEGVYHLLSYLDHIRNGLKPYNSIDIIRRKDLDEMNGVLLSIFKELLPKTKFLQMKRGEDIYISSHEVKAMMEKVKSTPELYEKAQTIFTG